MHLRDSEENDKGSTDNDGEGYPAPPAVPIRPPAVTIVVTAGPGLATIQRDSDTQEDHVQTHQDRSRDMRIAMARERMVEKERQQAEEKK